MFCENCGNQMDDGSKFCMSCGSKVEIKEAVQEVAASADSTATLESSISTDTEAVQVIVPPVAPAQPVQPAQAQPVESQFIQPQPTQSQPVQPTQVQPLQSQIAQPQMVQPQQSVASQPAKVKKPASITPLPVWKYIGIFLLMCIPVLGIVMLFVWSFGGSFNRNTRNFARATLIYALLLIVLTIVGYFTIWASLSSILSDFNLPII